MSVSMTVRCDVCDDAFESDQDTARSAYEQAREAGWACQVVNAEEGTVDDYCPECKSPEGRRRFEAELERRKQEVRRLRGGRSDG